MNAKNVQQLIELARAGNADAFCALYDVYRHRLYRYAYYRLGNAVDAEDAVSECVLSAWRQIGNLREPDAFPAWIFRILSHCCGQLIDQQITQRQHTSLDKAPDDAGNAGAENSATLQGGAASNMSSGAAGDSADTWLDLRQALDQLSDEERNIVLFSAVAGLKSREIADLTGKTAGSVRSSLSRSLKKLRGYLS